MLKTGRLEPAADIDIKSGAARRCPDCLTPLQDACGGCVRRQEKSFDTAQLQRKAVPDDNDQ